MTGYLILFGIFQILFIMGFNKYTGKWDNFNFARNLHNTYNARYGIAVLFLVAMFLYFTIKLIFSFT